MKQLVGICWNGWYRGTGSVFHLWW